MSENPLGEVAELHPDFTDPVADESVPFVVAYDPDNPDPTPPAERIAAVEGEDKETKAAAVGFFAPGGGADER